MKSALTLPLVLTLVSSCAPKAIVLGHPTGPKKHSSSENASATSDPLPITNPSGIQLLDPKDLTSLPEERDMRPSAANQESGPIIAPPPQTEED
ncbi:MAG: hypothetical protein ACQKBU_10905 [Verrucomicrobiales bacterium]